MIGYPADIVERFDLGEIVPFPEVGVGEWTALYSTNEEAFTAFGFVGGAPTGPDYESADMGESTFVKYNCQLCHAVTDEVSDDAIGPSLYGWAGTDRLLADGSIEVADAPYFKMSVIRPFAGASGYSDPMPSYEGQVFPFELDAMWAYVACLSDAVPRVGCPSSTSDPIVAE